MIIDFAERYRTHLHRELTDQRMKAGLGEAKTYEDYRALCAEADGLERALRLFDDLLKEYVEDED